jgi:hypothetical protein
MSKLINKGKPKKKRVVKHRRAFTHQRIDKDQRIRTREYTLVGSATTLKEARTQSKLYTSSDIKARIKLEDSKHNIYTYLKLNPIRRKSLEHLERKAREQLIIPPEQTKLPKPKRIASHKHSSHSGKLSIHVKEQLKQPNVLTKWEYTATLQKARTEDKEWLERKARERQHFYEDGFYPPELVVLILKYYYYLADGHIPFYDDVMQDVMIKNSALGSTCRYIKPSAYFEEPLIWKSDIDQALSKLRHNGNVSLPWTYIQKVSNEDTIYNYLPFMDDDQRVIVEQYILGVAKYPNSKDIFNKFITLLNGETN